MTTTQIIPSLYVQTPEFKAFAAKLREGPEQERSAHFRELQQIDAVAAKQAPIRKQATDAALARVEEARQALEDAKSQYALLVHGYKEQDYEPSCRRQVCTRELKRLADPIIADAVRHVNLALKDLMHAPGTHAPDKRGGWSVLKEFFGREPQQTPAQRAAELRAVREEIEGLVLVADIDVRATIASILQRVDLPPLEEAA